MHIRGTDWHAVAKPRIRPVWPLVLVAFFLILGQSPYWAGSSKWLAHALDHERAQAASAPGEQHHHVSHHDTLPASDAPADVEHDLQHEMEHVQLVPPSVAPQRLLPHAVLLAVFVIVFPARRGPERRFRPPRAVV